MKKTDIVKTWNYMKRNGFKSTIGAVKERMTVCYDLEYSYEFPSASLLQMQRETASWDLPKISILVPAYETPETYMLQLLESVVEQSYSHWELIIADASQTDKVQSVVSNFILNWKKSTIPENNDQESPIICYKKLDHNGGISYNTNMALQFATGEYIGLLDHDDILTPDALYEMAMEINKMEKEGNAPVFLYSDEDKFFEDENRYGSPNFKEKINLDLILSNNYICHFMVMRAEWMKKIKFRSQYDGAQDYDLVLQTIAALMNSRNEVLGLEKFLEQKIGYIPKVLYHWRSYNGSTAGNPASKNYAYAAGKRALESFLETVNWMAETKDTPHVGFYQVVFQPNIFSIRKDIGGQGGSVYNRDKKITSGILSATGECPYKNMPLYYAGPCNRAKVMQDAFALDARTLFLREELIPLYEEIIGIPYVRKECRNKKFSNQLDHHIWKQRSLELALQIHQKGYSLLWNPAIQIPE